MTDLQGGDAVICKIEGCTREVDRDELCFHHRVKGISFAFSSSGGKGRKGWNRTANDWKRENFGTTSDKELAQRGIVRASNYGF